MLEDFPIDEDEDEEDKVGKVLVEDDHGFERVLFDGEDGFERVLKFDDEDGFVKALMCEDDERLVEKEPLENDDEEEFGKMPMVEYVEDDLEQVLVDEDEKIERMQWALKSRSLWKHRVRLF